jgi:hypothetical protein
MADTFEYVKENDLYPQFEAAKKAAMPRHEPFDEFERIARNEPFSSIPKGMPRVTDGTLAALIQEQPKRVIQRVPTGVVEGADEWLNIFATYVLNHIILPNCNQVAALIQKSWGLTSKSLTYGSQPVLVQTVKRGDYFGPDFTLPYIKDVFLEPGKLSARDSNVIWVRAWFRPSDIEYIIAKERKLRKRSQSRGDKDVYESNWDIPNLKKALKTASAKDAQAETPSERGRNINDGFIQLVTCLQNGVNATFYTFCPDNPKNEQTVRRKVNKDPRGKIPLPWMYSNLDFSNPYGRGAVEVSGGMQNLLDSEVQSYQYMRSLMINPPIVIKGNVPSSVLKYAPAAQWRLGADPGADAQPAKLETATLQQFPQNYGLIKSQILNLNSSTDTSVSAEAGNPGFSKTDAGVKAQDMKLGISDNYMRKQFEDCFEEICETMINLYFADRNGKEEIQVDEETADKLRDIDQSIVSKDNKVRINFDTETPKLNFQVDAGSSEEEDDKDAIAGLQQLLADASKDPALPMQFAQAGKKFDIAEVYQQLFERYKIVNLDKIIEELPKVTDENGNEVTDPQAVQQLMQQLAPPDPNQQQEQPQEDQEHPLIKLMTSLNIKFTDLPEDSKHTLLETLGFPSEELSPTQQGLNTDQAKVDSAHAKAMADTAMQHHQMENQNAQADLERQHQASQTEATNQAKAAQAGAKPTGKGKPQPKAAPAASGGDSAQAPNLNQHDIMLVNELLKRGYGQQQIGQALALVKVGTPVEDILSHLNGNQNGQ